MGHAVAVRSLELGTTAHTLASLPVGPDAAATACGTTASVTATGAALELRRGGRGPGAGDIVRIDGKPGTASSVGVTTNQLAASLTLDGVDTLGIVG